MRGGGLVILLHSFQNITRYLFLENQLIYQNIFFFFSFLIHKWEVGTENLMNSIN